MQGTFDEIKKHSCWFLASGIFLSILGILALGSSVFTTFFTVVFLGSILLIAGLVKIVSAFWARSWGGFFLPVVSGLLSAVAGGVILWKPAVAALAITLLIAIVLMASGIAKMIGAAALRFEQWGWLFFSGIISLVLGGLILADWPISGLWVIGLFVGIDLLMYGISWIAISFAAKKI